MYFESFHYFVAVAELGSISRAAEKMFTSQQVVSTHIQRLERYYQAQLLNRTRPITLTPAGTVLLEAARKMLASMEQAERQIKETVRQKTTRLVLATGRAATPPFLSKLLYAFQEKMPAVELALMHPTSTQTRWTAPPPGAHVIVGELPFDEETKEVELFRDSYCLAVAPSVLEKAVLDAEELSVDQVRRLCCEVPVRLTDTLSEDQVRMVCQAVFPEDYDNAAKAAEICSTDLVKYLCVAGQCVTFLPFALASKALFRQEHVCLIPIPRLIPDKRIGLGVSKSCADAASVNAFVNVAKELFAPPSHTE